MLSVVGKSDGVDDAVGVYVGADVDDAVMVEVSVDVADAVGVDEGEKVNAETATYTCAPGSDEAPEAQPEEIREQ